MPKPICCSSLVLDVLDSHKLVLDRGGHHPALVCAFWIWIQIQRPNSNFLYYLLVRVTRVFTRTPVKPFIFKKGMTHEVQLR